MGSSPQRKKKVAYGEEPPPPGFEIVPIKEADEIVGFTIYDETGRSLKNRATIAAFIHGYFDAITREELENASIGYEDYVAHIRLAKR